MPTLAKNAYPPPTRMRLLAAFSAPKSSEECMKNFLAEGKTLTFTAPYTLTCAQGVLVGSIFGVASGDAAINTEVEVLLEGLFTLPKATGQAWSVGALIYWDNAARNCTTTVGTNKLIGVAQAASVSGDTLGNVRLNGAFIN